MNDFHTSLELIEDSNILKLQSGRVIVIVLGQPEAVQEYLIQLHSKGLHDASDWTKPMSHPCQVGKVFRTSSKLVTYWQPIAKLKVSY